MQNVTYNSPSSKLCIHKSEAFINNINIILTLSCTKTYNFASHNQQVFTNYYVIAKIIFNHPISLAICSLNSTYGKIVKRLSSPQKPSLITGITSNRQHRNRIVHTCPKSTKRIPIQLNRK